MTIYRQYSPDAGISFDSKTEAYRVYYLFSKYVTGTSVALDIDWKPQVGAKGSNAPGTTFVQTAADSLTWENGKTVRFRAWGRSNLAGCMASKKDTAKAHYYPDYTGSKRVLSSELVQRYDRDYVGYAEFDARNTGTVWYNCLNV